MSQNFDFALYDRRKGQTFLSPPAEPGVLPKETPIMPQIVASWRKPG